MVNQLSSFFKMLSFIPHISLFAFISLNVLIVYGFSDPYLCNFESNFCNWNVSTITSNDKWIFRSRSTSQPPEPGPLDSVTPGGRFIQFYPSNTTVKPNELYAEIHSIAQSPTKDPFCLTFYYHIFGDDVGSLLITVSHFDNFQIKKHVNYLNKTGSMADKWYRQKITIHPQTEQFIVNFQIYSNANSNVGTIALANFASSPGSCKTVISEPIVCDFENNECNWKALVSNDTEQVVWIVNNGDNKTKGAPLLDHTYGSSFGHYLIGRDIGYVDFDAPDPKGHRHTEFLSPYYNSTQCLQFWITGSGSDRIEVATRDLQDRLSASIWDAWGWDNGKEWKRNQLTVTKKAPFRIVIFLERNHPYLAIDDISVTSGACPAPANCDFNIDFCGFNNTGWKQGFGRMFNYSLVPQKIPKDRTLDIGMYIYADFTYPHGRTEAKLTTYNILPQTDGSCLRFWLYVAGKDIYLNVLAGGYVYWALESAKGIKNETWTQVEIEINKTASFQISFEAKASYYGVKKDFLAIDDIQYSNETCKPTTLKLTTPKSIWTQVPLTSVSCTFNESFCKWKTINTNTTNGVFQLSDPYHHKYGLPKYDPFGNNKAKYIYLNNDQPNGSVVKAIIHSIENKNQTMYTQIECMSFWFYMRTDGNANFSIVRTKYKNPYSWPILYSKAGSFGEKWHFVVFEYDTYYEEEEDYNIFINATIESGVIAFSNIQIIKTKCSSIETNALFMTFEDGMGNWKTNAYSNKIFRIYDGKNLTSKIIDHTFGTVDGHFFAYDFENSNASGYRLYSPDVKAFDSCVTLWYYIRGNQSLEIQVKRPVYSANGKGDIVHKVSGDEGPFWHPIQIDAEPDDQTWSLLLEIEGIKTPKGIVAIDDILIEIGKKCPPTGRCDFETDTYLWQSISPAWAQSLSAHDLNLQNIRQVLTTQFVWNRHSGIHDANRLWPLRDHTTKTPEGSYLVMSADPPRNNGDRAVLMSQRYALTPNIKSLCFSMAYILQSGASLTLYKTEDFFNIKTITTDNIISVTNSDWKTVKLNVMHENPNSNYMYLFLVGSVGPNPSSFAAIDDIAVDFNECGVETNFICSDDGMETIQRSKVCDFRVDCSNGRDEANCGSCPFSISLCSYEVKQSNITSFKWHSINASLGYIFAKQDLLVDLKSTAELVSPVINYASSSCRLSFQYHYGGNQLSDHLSVYIRLNNQEDVQLWDSRAQVIKSVNGYFSIVEAIIGRIRTPFKIIFRAYSSGNKADYIALKNVQLLYCEPLSPALECDGSHNQNFRCLNGGCIDKSLICDHTDDCGDNSDEEHCETYIQRCNFEDGFCGWNNAKPSGNINSMWKLQFGTQDLLLGPTRDHSKGISSGKYLLMRNESVKYTGNYIKLYSRLEGPVIMPNPNCEMRFHYDLEGDGFVSLSINTIHNKSINDREVWFANKISNSFAFIRGEIKFSNELTPFQVVILGSIKARVNSSSLMQPYIALDDISFTPECVSIDGLAIKPITTTINTTNIGYFTTISSISTEKPSADNKHNPLPIILGILFGIVAIVCIAVAFVYFKYFCYKSSTESSLTRNVDRVDSINNRLSLHKYKHDNKSVTSSF